MVKCAWGKNVEHPVLRGTAPINADRYVCLKEPCSRWLAPKILSCLKHALGRRVCIVELLSSAPAVLSPSGVNEKAAESNFRFAPFPRLLDSRPLHRICSGGFALAPKCRNRALPVSGLAVLTQF